MKPEPLKGKRIPITCCGLSVCDVVDYQYKEKDIRSAVEWLKDEIINKNYDGKTLIEIIDEAFEDVVKTIKEKGE